MNVLVDSPISVSVLFSNLLANNRDRGEGLLDQEYFRSNDLFTYFPYESYTNHEGGTLLYRTYGKFRNLEVLKFLKKYFPDTQVDAVYHAGAEVERSEVSLPEENPAISVPTPVIVTPPTIATPEEIHKVRQALLDAKASLVFQAEGLLHIDWFGFKNPYNSKDMEFALLTEMLNI